MGCHGNHEILYNQNALIFRTIFFLHSSGPIEQIYTRYKISYVFNVGQLPPWIHYPMFSLIYKISLIFMNMQN